MDTVKQSAHAKVCCDRAHRQIVKDLVHCDAPSLTAKEKHHCYRHVAWRRGREARRCALEER